jgi:hypothetical protein
VVSRNGWCASATFAGNGMRNNQVGKVVKNTLQRKRKEQS